ncbi:sirohydrochlorin cobaltochelatase [Hominifimenecus sp. rT4P-3]|uniref:sirohydrochlorin cobaltochelatase n=1 Tax=Hominifimenecus sp. rT4P-3 TaxID=3242979 RepID=UPI003DA357BB
MKQAILVVSFGTSYPDTRKKTIEKLEEEIRQASPNCTVYRAWTSKMIIRKLRERDQLIIHTVPEALEQMEKDGITDLIVQPTHIINGIENDQMKQEILAKKSVFSTIRFGDPLLTTTEDHVSVLKALMEEYSDLPEDEAIVFMGHGTTHHANAVYAALDYTLKDLGYPRAYMGTVEAYPSLEHIFRRLQEASVRRVHLVPFMLVAGDHANNDMASDDKDSWRSQFEAAGYEVVCHLKGLGECKGIRNIYLEHLKQCKNA